MFRFKEERGKNEILTQRQKSTKSPHGRRYSQNDKSVPLFKSKNGRCDDQIQPVGRRYHHLCVFKTNKVVRKQKIEFRV